MLKYKADVIDMLRAAGYGPAVIRSQKIMGEAMLQKLRQGQMVSWATLDKICELLNVQPGEIIEYVRN